MLVSKLLRLEDTLIQEIEDLAQKLSEKEYTSFSALVRKLIRMGADDMKAQLSPIGRIKMNIVKDQDLNQVLWAIFAKKYQQGVSFKCIHLSDFKQSFQIKAQEVFFMLTNKGLVKSYPDIEGYETIGDFRFVDLEKLALENFSNQIMEIIFDHIRQEFANGVLGHFRAHPLLPMKLGIANTCQITNCVDNKCGNHRYRDTLIELSDCGVLVSESSIRTRNVAFSDMRDFGLHEPSLYVRHLLHVAPPDPRLHGDMLTFPPSLK
jgi:hypothetical protein